MKLIIVIVSFFFTLLSGGNRRIADTASFHFLENKSAVAFSHFQNKLPVHSINYYSNLQPSENFFFSVAEDEDEDENRFALKKCKPITGILSYPSYASVFTLHKIDNKFSYYPAFFPASKYILHRNIRV
jgi:hypothetical protein